MGVEALLSTQIIDTTTAGRAVMTAADAAAARTAIDAAATSHTHAASDIVSGIIETARLATGTASASTYLRGDQTWATVAAAGVGGSTGAVDNAVLRADGTGGTTLQASSIVIADNATASPNNTVNHASIQATGGTTNVSVSLVPKGSGAFCLAIPDGAATGGNARGAGAVDLQMSRSAATQVASGLNSFQTGSQNTTSGEGAFSCGYQNVSSGSMAFCQGQLNSATGRTAVALNSGNISAADYSVGHGYGVNPTRMTQRSFGSGSFAGLGQSQGVEFVVRNRTTDGITPVSLQLGPVLFSATERPGISSGRILFATLLLVGSKSDGTAVATYMRKFAIQNLGGTTALVGAAETIGTDVSAGTSMSVAADNTNDALNVSVVGVAGETWRWLGLVYGVELAYGT